MIMSEDLLDSRQWSRFDQLIAKRMSEHMGCNLYVDPIPILIQNQVNRISLQRPSLPNIF